MTNEPNVPLVANIYTPFAVNIVSGLEYLNEFPSQNRHFPVFRCVLASLYERVSVRPLVRPSVTRL